MASYPEHLERPVQTGTELPRLVELKGITKRFGALLANDQIDLAIGSGEIVGLVGENGAGKSTLMNILFGLVRADSGQILVGGKELFHHTPEAAIALGINMVHQHFMLVPTLSVAENIVLGREPRRGPLLNMDVARASVQALIHQHGFDIDPRVRVGFLPVGQRQRVEILRALYREARVLILDEPTAVLAPGDVEHLFVTLRKLAAMGIGLVLIAHKLDEVLAVCNRLVVLRHGKKIGERLSSETSPAELTRMMIGEDAPAAGAISRRTKHANRAGASLVVQQLAALSAGMGPNLAEITFTIAKGEIVVIAGVEGNGQSTLERALVGLVPLIAGRLLIDGRDVSHIGVAERRRAGLGYVPQDRHASGLLLDLSLVDNMLLGRERNRDFSRAGIVKVRGLSDRIRSELQRFDVRFRSIQQPARSLSGGNQQKLVLSRAVVDNPKVLVASQIGRGLDVGAVAALYQRLQALRELGTAILLISFDLDEVLTLADRIYVIRAGRLIAEMDGATTSKTDLGAAITAAAA